MPPITEREAVVLADEKSVLSREKVVDMREESADMREKTLRDQAGAAKVKVVRVVTQLREANENLVIAAVQAQTMTNAAEKTSAEMTHKANHDMLTGLPVRALLIDRLAQAITIARSRDKKIVLLSLPTGRPLRPRHQSPLLSVIVSNDPSCGRQTRPLRLYLLANPIKILQVGIQ